MCWTLARLLSSRGRESVKFYNAITSRLDGRRGGKTMIAFSSFVLDWTGKVKHYNGGQATRTREQLHDQIFFCEQNSDNITTTTKQNQQQDHGGLCIVSAGMECNVCHTFAINYVPINCDCGQ